MKRERYTVGPSPAGADRAWTVLRDGEVLGEWDTQAAAQQAAESVARYRLATLGKVSEVQIKGRDGKVREANTYGDDPRETQG